MDGYYFSRDIDPHRTLCVAPLTDRNIESSGETLSDVSGYFLFERKGRGEAAEIEIIAHVLSEDAALKLRQILSLD